MTHTELRQETGQGAWTTCLLLTGISWFWMLTGSGTGMSVLAMSTWHYPVYSEPSSMGISWTAGYALIMLLMWWAMMLAMMLPAAVLHRVSTKPRRTISQEFLLGYSLVWLGFSIFAVALQYMAELLGLIDGMQIRSSSRTLSIALLGIAAASQIPTLLNSRTIVPAANALLSRSGFEYGVACVRMIAPMMLLMFVGGLMNVVWMLALIILIALQKIWPNSRIPATLTIVLCLGLIILA